MSGRRISEVTSGSMHRTEPEPRRVVRVNECPVAKKAMQTQASAQALAGSLKQLRRMMRRCRKCAAAFDCPAMLEFDRAFRVALKEINAEWHLGGGSE